MKNFFRTHKKLVKDSGILLVGSYLGYVLNYIFQLYMGRALGPAGYGIMSTLFAFLIVFNILSNTIFLTASNFTARFVKKKEFGKIKYKFSVMLRWILNYGLLIYLIFLLLIPLLEVYTKIFDYFAFALLGIIGILSLINAVYVGIFNGMQRFLLQVSMSSFAAFVKLLAGIVLVSLGFGYRGSLMAVLVSVIFTIALAYLLFRKALPYKAVRFKARKMLDYSSSVLLSTVFFTLIFTIDVIVLKSLFPAREVGLYSAGAMIGRVFFFGTSVIATLVFPKMSGEDNPEKTRRILVVSVIAILFSGLLFMLVLKLFPKLIITLLYGSKYVDVSSMLWLFGGIFVLYSLNNIYRIYYYSKQRFRAANLAVLFFVLEVIGLYLFHETLLIVVVFLFILNFIYFLCNLVLVKNEG